jgi:hypothetical protein
MVMEKKDYQRWYEKYDNLASIFNYGLYLPKAQQDELGAELLECVQGYHNILKDLCKYENQPDETKWDMERTQRKRRWYDHVPQLHEAYVKMLVLPEPYLGHLDFKCISILKKFQIARYAYYKKVV